MRWRTNGLLHWSQVNSVNSSGDSASRNNCPGLGFAPGPRKPMGVTLSRNYPYVPISRRTVEGSPFLIDSCPPGVCEVATGVSDMTSNTHTDRERPRAGDDPCPVRCGRQRRSRVSTRTTCCTRWGMCQRRSRGCENAGLWGDRLDPQMHTDEHRWLGC